MIAIMATMAEQLEPTRECLGQDIWLYHNAISADLCERIIAKYCDTEHKSPPGRDYDNRECEFVPITCRHEWADLDREFTGIVRRLLMQHYADYDSLIDFCDEGYEVCCYKPGEVAKLHCDGIVSDVGDRIRLWSLVFYLNECVGGETVFPRQGLSVSPKTGLAAVWPTHMTHPHKTLPAEDERYVLITWSGFVKDQRNA